MNLKCFGKGRKNVRTHETSAPPSTSSDPPPSTETITCRQRNNRLFSPGQDALEDIKILEVNIFGDQIYYEERHKLLKNRERAISPFHVVAVAQGPHVPVTPPMKEMTSLHILRLTHPRQDRYKVDLFIRDEDLYFVAFRIMNKSNEQIGRCFSFNDSHIVLPNFLNAVKIPMSSSYGPPEDFTPPGNQQAIDSMFFAFATFRPGKTCCNTQFRRAVYNAIGLYCESRRLQSVFMEMYKRIEEQSPSEEVSPLLWDRIHNWTKLGVHVLEHLDDDTAKKKKHLDGEHTRLDLRKDLPEWCSHLKFSVMGSLIGENGEVLIINSNQEHLKRILSLSDEAFNSRSRVHNHEFTIPQQAACADVPL